MRSTSHKDSASNENNVSWKGKKKTVDFSVTQITFPYELLIFFTTGDTPLCCWRLQSAKDIIMQVVSKKHFPVILKPMFQNY